MIARLTRIFSHMDKNTIRESRGGGLVEVLLAMVIIAIAAPFTYSMVSEMTHTMHNMAVANDIISLRGGVLNFVRINQDLWPQNAQIKLSESELAELSDTAIVGFIDKYSVQGASVVDVYLAFEFHDMTPRRVAQIAQNLGTAGAIVGPDKIAYGDTWAVTSPDFKSGALVYKISRNLSDIDTSRFLHRTSSGDEGLNVMERELNMGGNDIFDVGKVSGKSITVRNLDSGFVATKDLSAKNVYFPSGATISGDDTQFGSLRVSGDITGFRTITGTKLNGPDFSVKGRIIADKATIKKTVNVGRDFTLKSSSVRTVSGFTGMTVSSVYAPYISTGEISFCEDCGLTVSGELLMSSNSPIRFGNWSFPSTTPPSFKTLSLSRAAIPLAPNNEEFKTIFKSDWQTK